MNTNQFARTRLTFGKDNMEKLYNARVIVFGIGGVGSYVVEALVRSGIGAIDIVDDDKICLSNLNRQLFALQSTIGKDKVDVAEERIHDINPDCKVTKWKTFYMPDTADQFDFSQYDYIVDCIDTVTGKLEIITRAKALKKPVISCMGAGNKVDPTKLKVADITRTSVCPLARVMRNELKKRRIKRLKVVFSTETAIPPQADETDPDFEDTSGVTPDRKGTPKKQTPGSNAFVPSVAGMIIAAEVVKDLTQFHMTDLFKD
ncbi:tRNA A37 threonylcarbamoyladenosine dehydratase [Treponema bryantii]|uniref:tRNA A37 threonylcarbamoyladenosine dehydratase n=1 Tax=Treponema bryantii TaxID=163 RepID=A0A1I3J7K7_9SPIR|nr:tRNA threonylcarbamoyladenosine dehydratase [Treponema bryantii]SFI56163.1 tRNA A37 threonylcarbamoyladenosine dehydratase [Treponema bryantii]